MYTKNVTVGNRFALTYQSEAEVVKKANEYRSELLIESDGKSANAKSLLGVLALGLVAGCKIAVSADGADEIEAVESLEKLIVA